VLRSDLQRITGPVLGQTRVDDHSRSWMIGHTTRWVVEVVTPSDVPARERFIFGGRCHWVCGPRTVVHRVGQVEGDVGDCSSARYLVADCAEISCWDALSGFTLRPRVCALRRSRIVRCKWPRGRSLRAPGCASGNTTYTEQHGTNTKAWRARLYRT
jgi:hypothetical protein